MTEFDPRWLIHAGGFFYILAFVIREELLMRILVLTGSGLYILYYFLYPDVPLWDAIMTSTVMIFANLYVVSQVILERTTLRMSDDEKRLFDAFETLNPGQFRHLLKEARWHTAFDPEGTALTREGEPAPALYYIFEGAISVQKGTQQFRLPEGNFVGEIAYILGTETTATTIAPEGVRYVRWDAEALSRLSMKKPALGNALNALLTRDLAQKLTTSYQPSDALPADANTEQLLQNA
ncbi:MAG: cyclic nucleotide-binding domain-containing protein [Erythrobacter sp.]